MKSNVHEIRRNQAKYGKRKPGLSSDVKPAAKPHDPKPPVLIGDGEEITNTWSSQTALAKTMARGMEGEDGPTTAQRQGAQLQAARLKFEAGVEHALGLGHNIVAAHEAASEFLVVHGTNSTQRGESRWPPTGSKGAMADNIWHAAFHGYVQIVEYLVYVRCLPPDVRNRWGQTPLHCACREGHARVAAALLAAGARTWLKEQELCTPLHLAAYFGHEDCVAVLLHYGASVTCLNAFRQTPLDEAAGQAKGLGVLTFEYSLSVFIDLRLRLTVLQLSFVKCSWSKG
eukprot:SAG31_NODE_2341_length_5913_cov_2.173689_5_plen_286_part_00